MNSKYISLPFIYKIRFGCCAVSFEKKNLCDMTLEAIWKIHNVIKGKASVVVMLLMEIRLSKLLM